MTVLVVGFAQPEVCPLCEGYPALEVQPLDGRAAALMPCPLCVTPDPIHDFLSANFLASKGNQE
ncbi:hypothetical protein MOQ72_28995 [Saccharopolyspora sp. K220]|uniref:hypothetical protein n=1 Tax=Saccharopolyspora soli TaxID=2926618 RepID=UPI001F57E843|nr:hypothetical protein [Saccharopolyspora soli]MCI2421478.1 hypothetical protein [Saccharopolyspora soli]